MWRRCRQQRTDLASDVIVCDGIGSGMRAYIAATIHVARLLSLLREGFSPRRAFSSLVGTPEMWRDPSQPYAAISLARILNGGETAVLSYDAPAPLLVSRDNATVLPSRPLLAGHALARQSNCFLAHCRHGNTLNIFTGPPIDRRTDEAVVRRFLALDGTKVVCGATTAAIVGKAMGRKLAMDPVPTILIAAEIRA